MSYATWVPDDVGRGEPNRPALFVRTAPIDPPDILPGHLTHRSNHDGRFNLAYFVQPCRWPLVRDIEALAMIEGISRADVVRRAVLLDIRRRKEEWLQAQRRKAADSDIEPDEPTPIAA
jgi:hypothetical protein